MVKFYKYKTMAEKTFIDYEDRLEEQESKRQEEEHVHESEMHLYKEEKGDLTPEIEGVRIEQNKLKQGLNSKQEVNMNLQPMLDKIEKIYKEKEVERGLRLEAEKKVALAIQQTQEFDQKVADFTVLQNNNVDLIKKIAGSLYKRINADIQRIK
jgi:hypothetical protein